MTDIGEAMRGDGPNRFRYISGFLETGEVDSLIDMSTTAALTAAGLTARKGLRAPKTVCQSFSHGIDPLRPKRPRRSGLLSMRTPLRADEAYGTGKLLADDLIGSG